MSSWGGREVPGSGFYVLTRSPWAAVKKRLSGNREDADRPAGAARPGRAAKTRKKGSSGSSAVKPKPTGRAVLSFPKTERRRGTRDVLGTGPEQLTGGMRLPLMETGQTEWKCEERTEQTDGHGLTLAAIAEGSSRP